MRPQQHFENRMTMKSDSGSNQLVTLGKECNNVINFCVIYQPTRQVESSRFSYLSWTKPENMAGSIFSISEGEEKLDNERLDTVTLTWMVTYQEETTEIQKVKATPATNRTVKWYRPRTWTNLLLNEISILLKILSWHEPTSKVHVDTATYERSHSRCTCCHETRTNIHTLFNRTRFYPDTGSATFRKATTTPVSRPSRWFTMMLFCWQIEWAGWWRVWYNVFT